MKILVFTEKPFASAAVKAISDVINASGNELELVERGTRDDLLNAVKEADGLIVRSDVIDAEVMNAAPNLKVIVRAGAGYDNIAGWPQRGTHRQRLRHESHRSRRIRSRCSDRG